MKIYVKDVADNQDRSYTSTMNNIRLTAELNIAAEYRALQPKPSVEYLDEQADRKFDGGFVRSKHQLCESCFVMKSRNGSCNCDEQRRETEMMTNILVLL